MLFAALAEVHLGLEQHEGDGFVTITAASDQGMVDIYNRRPVVFAPLQASESLEPSLKGERAEELTLECSKPQKRFG